MRPPSAGAAAAGRSSSCVVSSQISVSTEAQRSPPRVSTTPNAVAQNRNTTLAADTMAGRSAGSVTVRNTCAGEAPSAAAASAGRGSSDSQAAPTARITTETLKKTTPATIATARRVLGLTPDELGDLLHVSPRTIRHWESGKHVPPAGALIDYRMLLDEHDMAVSTVRGTN